MDVPYADHFFMRENIFVLSPTDNSVRVIMRSENCCVFVKSTFFKKNILSRSIIDVKSYFNHWLQSIETRGYLSPVVSPAQWAKRIEEKLWSVKINSVAN